MNRSPEVEYDMHGNGEAVLTIHGAIVADSFAPMMEEPALDGYRLIRYRRRGYGGSELPSRPPSIAEHVRDGLALLEHLDVARAHVVAHSGGGPIAVQLAIDAPEVVRSLVLLEPALQSAEMAAAFDAIIAPLVEMHRTGNTSKAVHLWMRATGGSGWRKEIERMIPDAGDRADRDAGGTFEGDLPAMRSWDFNAAGASRIAQPVLYIVGSRKESNLEPVISMFRAAVPHTELVVIPDADHNLHVTNATVVAEVIAPFLQRHAI
jgi:3-oxoadipate enol-lactonase